MMSWFTTEHLTTNSSSGVPTFPEDQELRSYTFSKLSRIMLNFTLLYHKVVAKTIHLIIDFQYTIVISLLYLLIDSLERLHNLFSMSCRDVRDYLTSHTGVPQRSQWLPSEELSDSALPLVDLEDVVMGPSEEWDNFFPFEALFKFYRPVIIALHTVTPSILCCADLLVGIDKNGRFFRLVFPGGLTSLPKLARGTVPFV